MPHRILVNDPYDVIAMRQEVRQVARSVGMGLTQQAKITAAVSAIARELLAINTNLTITIHIAARGEHPALEVSCEAVERATAQEVLQLEEALSMGEARALVDEINLVPADHGKQLTLRMWLGH